MAASNINRVIITGNLTSDPELRALPSGSSVCKLRVACNTRRKDGASGEWVDKPNYFDVTVWGAQGENCAKYLAKGRGVAIDGRLEWREWETPEGNKRQAVDIVADSVQFLGGGGRRAAAASPPAPTSPSTPPTSSPPPSAAAEAARPQPTTTSRSRDPAAHRGAHKHSPTGAKGARRVPAGARMVRAGTSRRAGVAGVLSEELRRSPGRRSHAPAG